MYNWIYSRVIDFDVSKLIRKGKSRKAKETRVRFNIGNPINKNPKEVKKRNTFGHWQFDTIVSSRGKSKACLATFVERKTRFYIALPMVDRSKN
ncbi:MAG: IS30 family transposase, partial [Anaerococcus sp.]|nr:IS30 family transposase [Anaerococcus sp.]